LINAFNNKAISVCRKKEMERKKKLTEDNAVIEGNHFGLQARRSGMNLLRSSVA
jgi:hypothetical protein